MGPTASGKTELAIALAERLGGEIVSADSVQIYRGFDVGSGKPTAGERARAPHHLVDVARSARADRRRPLGPARRRRDRRRARARHACRSSAAARSSGSRRCSSAWPRRPPATRRSANATAPSSRPRAAPALHAALARGRPGSAARLHPNDFVRVSRALEVHELTGKPMSAWQREHGFRDRAIARASSAIACDPRRARPSGSRRASARWLAAGWVDEVRALLARGYGERAGHGRASATRRSARRSRARSPRGDLETAIVRATRVFARRQRTWLNHADVTWLR